MKTALIVVLVLAVLGGGYWYMKSYSAPVMQPTDYSGMQATPTSEAGDAMMETGETKAFTLDAYEFGYDQKTLTVNNGDTVKITLTNSGTMMHDWIVDEFSGAKTKQIKKGQTDTITFVADQAGTFEYYCSVGTHRANGMVGKLIVQ